MTQFRPMRRSAQQLPPEECGRVLTRATSGVLSLVGDGGYPYGVPMSHVYDGGRLYFHSALSGHKVDAIARCPLASFTVIDADEVVERRYTTRYRSVIAFGRVAVVADEESRERVAALIAARLCPHQSAEANAGEIASALHRACVLEMRIDHITGKQGLEMMRPAGHAE